MHNLEEYRHPELYDLENPDFEPEGPFYLSLLAETGGPVLELGCGTGRISIPLAQAGYQVTGLDVVPAMLDRARRKAGALDPDLPIEWIEADARDYHLDRQFNFIFENGSVFMHMLTNADQDAFLARVREHLAPGGRFVVSLFFPHPDALLPVADEQEWFTYEDQRGRTVRVSGIEDYDQVLQVKLETAYRRVTGPGEQEILHIAPLSLRYTFPQEMERLLAQAGLKVISRYGGPDRSPLSGDSRFMVFVCGLPNGGSGVESG